MWDAGDGQGVENDPSAVEFRAVDVADSFQSVQVPPRTNATKQQDKFMDSLLQHILVGIRGVHVVLVPLEKIARVSVDSATLCRMQS